jgi:hypothetical protein
MADFCSFYLQSGRPVILAHHRAGNAKEHLQLFFACNKHCALAFAAENKSGGPFEAARCLGVEVLGQVLP